MNVSNVNIFGFDESVKGAKFPMSVDTDSLNCDLTTGIDALGRGEIGSGHDNFLNGIIVQFDLTCSNKMWVEMERYHFIDFVSSQSTMHRAAKMDFAQCFNGYVTARTMIECNRLKAAYQAEPTPICRLAWNSQRG